MSKHTCNLMTVRIFFHRYVAWNMHEAQEGQYDFNGNNDLVSFIQMAQSSGLLVIVRAGKTMDELQLRKSLLTNSSLTRILYLQNEPISLLASRKFLPRTWL